jgi:hypothetical protein
VSEEENGRAKSRGDQIRRDVQHPRDGDVVHRAADVPRHQRRGHLPRVVAQPRHGHDRERERASDSRPKGSDKESV